MKLHPRMVVLRGLGKALYFCVPRNDKLLSYWDTVADRLFKIRSSLNIQGIFRQLPLFEPPIDPAPLAVQRWGCSVPGTLRVARS